MRVFTQNLSTHVKKTLIFLEDKDEIIVLMYIKRIPNRNSPPAALLRESSREDGKVSKRTLANL
ncbi:Mobile element protein [Richelia intracellularis]|nr:Mobile element protein [Richelia intracellularis]